MSLSVCIIGRNCERDIIRCIRSVEPVADQIVYLDTGSTDKTLLLLAYFPTITIERFQWCDDFAAARNRSIELAKCNWILWVDTDDELTEDSYEDIRTIKQDRADCAFRFNVHNVGVPPHMLKYVGKPGQQELFSQLRMFPNRPGIRFEGRLHEDVLPSIQQAGLDVFAWPDIVINHFGYMNPRVLTEKIKRNCRMILMDKGWANCYEFSIGDKHCFYNNGRLAIYNYPDLRLYDVDNPKLVSAAPEQIQGEVIALAMKIVIDEANHWSNVRFAVHGNDCDFRDEISRLERAIQNLEPINQGG